MREIVTESLVLFVEELSLLKIESIIRKFLCDTLYKEKNLFFVAEMFVIFEGSIIFTFGYLSSKLGLTNFSDYS